MSRDEVMYLQDVGESCDKILRLDNCLAYIDLRYNKRITSAKN